MSFTNDESRKIMKDNEILCKKIIRIAFRSPIHSSQPPRLYTPSSYINRTRKEKQMYLDNQVSRIGVLKQNLSLFHILRGVAQFYSDVVYDVFSFF